MSAARVRALALHAAWRCRSSGACCTSGWEIPVEPESEQRLRAALRSGALRPPSAATESTSAAAQRPDEEACLPSAAGLPHGARTALGCDARGHCLFFETNGGNRCAIHAQLGEDALPSACRHFPRVVRLAPRGVDLTLSHYCPTAASLLFEGAPGDAPADPDPLLQIVEAPAAFPPSWSYQGLDARQAVPPLLRPGVLMSWEGLERWEAHAVAVMAEAGSPEAAVLRLAADAERIRAWTPRDGDFDRFLEREITRSEPIRGSGASGDDSMQESVEAWSEVAATVPASHWPGAAPHRHPGLAAERRRLESSRSSAFAAAGGTRFHAPIRRWLATKAFASWIALQGEGLRTAVFGLRVALGVLRVESLRGCVESERALDRELLREAFRRADLRLVHLADPDALARRLSRCER